MSFYGIFFLFFKGLSNIYCCSSSFIVIHFEMYSPPHFVGLSPCLFSPPGYLKYGCRMHLRMDFIHIQPFERSELCACFDVYNYLDAELKQYKDIQRSYCVFDIVK